MTEVRRRYPRSIWVLLLAFLVLVIAGLAYGLNRFDDDLTTRAAVALERAGIPVGVHVDGRDAYLTGSLEFEGDVAAAVAVVREVRGVRHVTSEIDFSIAGERPLPPGVVEPPEAPSEPELTLRAESGVFTAQGRVPDEAVRAAIVAAAEAEYGDVSDRLQVLDGLASPPWLDAIPGVVSVLAPIGDWSLSFGSEGAGLSGIVPDETSRTRIGDVVASQLGGVAFANRLEVVVPMAATMRAEGNGGVVVLRGTVRDRATADAIVAAAEQAPGVGEVIDELDVERGATEATWVSSLPDMYAATAGLDPWSFEVADGRLVVFGRGPADGTVGEAIDAFSAIPGFTVDTGDLEVSETAVAETLTELLAGGANFATGSATLSAEATALLDEAAELLIANPSTALIVEGHTDDQGGEDANLALSQARAQAVVDYLVTVGVSLDRLTAVGFGESRPIADNETLEGRAQNRRIDFVVEGGTG